MKPHCREIIVSHIFTVPNLGVFVDSLLTRYLSLQFDLEGRYSIGRQPYRCTIDTDNEVHELIDTCYCRYTLYEYHIHHFAFPAESYLT
jgi:hypothetical protein